MRKHHNKLYFGKYTHKATFKVPNINVLYPTSDFYIDKMLSKFKIDEPIAKLGNFIMDNRQNMKFRIVMAKLDKHYNYRPKKNKCIR